MIVSIVALVIIIIALALLMVFERNKEMKEWFKKKIDCCFGKEKKAEEREVDNVNEVEQVQEVQEARPLTREEIWENKCRAHEAIMNDIKELKVLFREQYDADMRILDNMNREVDIVLNYMKFLLLNRPEEIGNNNDVERQ